MPVGPEYGATGRGPEEWETRASAFIHGLRSVDVRVWIGLALVLLGLAVLFLAVVTLASCPSDAIFWAGIGVVLVGAGVFLLAEASWPATIVLTIVGVGLALFGYLTTSATSCGLHL